MTHLPLFLLGALVGAAAVVLMLWRQAPSRMLNTNVSRFGFDETVRALITATEAAGWKVQTVHPIAEIIAEKGHTVRPATVIEICRADLAGRILADDAGRRVTALMPCRVAVQEDAAGRVHVSRMNSGLLSRLFGGVVQTVMSEAVDSSEAAFKPLFAD